MTKTVIGIFLEVSMSPSHLVYEPDIFVSHLHTYNMHGTTTAKRSLANSVFLIQMLLLPIDTMVS